MNNQVHTPSAQNIIPGAQSQSFIKRSDLQDSASGPKRELNRLKRSYVENGESSGGDNQDLITNNDEKIDDQDTKYLTDLFRSQLFENPINDDFSKQLPIDIFETTTPVPEIFSTTSFETDSNVFLTSTPTIETTPEETSITEIPLTEVASSSTVEQTEVSTSAFITEINTETTTEVSTTTSETSQNEDVNLVLVESTEHTTTIIPTTTTQINTTKMSEEDKLKEIQEKEEEISVLKSLTTSSPKSLRTSKKARKNSSKSNRNKKKLSYENYQSKNDLNDYDLELDPSVDWSSIMNSDSEKTIYESFYELLDNGIESLNQNQNFLNLDDAKVGKSKLFDLVEPVQV